MASNVVVRTDAIDNYMPDQSKSTGRIDGIVAAIMALGRAMVAEKPVDLDALIRKRGGLLTVNV
jgi:phage terminase large subunit-like protein